MTPTGYGLDDWTQFKENGFAACSGIVLFNHEGWAPLNDEGMPLLKAYLETATQNGEQVLCQLDRNIVSRKLPAVKGFVDAWGLPRIKLSVGMHAIEGNQSTLNYDNYFEQMKAGLKALCEAGFSKRVIASAIPLKSDMTLEAYAYMTRSIATFQPMLVNDFYLSPKTPSADQLAAITASWIEQAKLIQRHEGFLNYSIDSLRESGEVMSMLKVQQGRAAAQRSSEEAHKLAYNALSDVINVDQWLLSRSILDRSSTRMVITNDKALIGSWLAYQREHRQAIEAYISGALPFEDESA